VNRRGRRDEERREERGEKDRRGVEAQKEDEVRSEVALMILTR
jgi:hypothetical protein